MSRSNCLFGLLILVSLALSRSQQQCPSANSSDETQVLRSLASTLRITVWNDTIPQQRWPGIRWNSQGRVEAIVLVKSNLSGALSSMVWDELPSLERLDLSQNNISLLQVDASGCRNTALRLLNLSSNSLRVSLANISVLERLETLDLSANFLVAVELPRLSSLRSLNLSINNLTGSVSIGGNHGLRELELRNNGFSGLFPEAFPELAELANLTRLDISSNKFQGQIPDTWSNNSELEYLDLHNNSLQGGIPRSLRRLRKLSLLSAGSNNLSGPLEVEDGDFPALEFLHLSENQLNGSIPSRIGRLSNLTMLILTRNKFGGSLPPELGNCSKLREIWLNYNSLEGTIPDELSHLSELVLLVLSGNKIGGNLPSKLANCSRLRDLWLEQNQFSGELPESFARLSELLVLSASNNNLNGSIPDSYGGMRSLIGLDVGSNSMSGTLPASIANISMLQFLFLSNNSFSGSIPEWLPNLTNVRAVDFSKNRFSGAIPVNISGLFANVPLYRMTRDIPLVHAQSLVYNGFALPTTIDFSHNNLSGSIPATIGDLHNIQVLDLSYNMLTGPIPDSLGNARNLSRVTLSGNQLSGRIPASIAGLSFLNVFDVSNNKLVGEIPRSSQLSGMNVSCFAGNDLCGLPLDRNCSSGGSGGHGGGIGTVSSDSSPTPLVPIVVAVFAAAFLCIFLAMYFALLRKRHKLYSNSDRDAANFSVAFCEKLPEQICPRKLAAATDNYSNDHVVGDGGFGVVYRAVLENGQVVAVKKLSSNGLQGDREFLAEIQTLGEIKHKNLVPLLGYCSDQNDRVLIYKYLTNGSLDTWLYCRETGMKPLDWPTRIKIARGAAQGVTYLHQGGEQRHSIIHRDIKVSNILLDEEFEAHVADFGLARLVNAGETHVSTDVAGTIGYIPPEYSHKCVATPKGDVYSFGVVLLEMLTAKRPTDQLFRKASGLVPWIQGRRSGEERKMALDECLREQHDGGGGAELEQMMEMMRIACWCCRDAPSKRPSMQEVAALLERLEKRAFAAAGAAPLLPGFEHEQRNSCSRSSSSSSGSASSKNASVAGPDVAELAKATV